MSFDPVIALLGAKALYLLYAWLLGCVATSYLSGRKGYGEQVGLATGMLLPVISIVFWLLWPAKPESRWKLQGVFGTGGQTAAEARAELHAEEEKS
jgi:uncharacterized RDD family membrane protein YckC